MANILDGICSGINLMALMTGPNQRRERVVCDHSSVDTADHRRHGLAPQELAQVERCHRSWPAATSLHPGIRAATSSLFVNDFCGLIRCTCAFLVACASAINR